MHVLPKAGGLLDQDALFIHYLAKVKEADHIREDTDRKIQQGSQA